MKIQTKKSRKPLLVVAAVLLIAGAAAAFVILSAKKSPATTAAEVQAQTDAKNQTAIDQQKDSFADKEAATPTANTKDDSTNTGSTGSSTKQKASVVITFAGQNDSGAIEVNAYIPDHYEDGTCTLTFTRGTAKVVKSTPAYRDATTTICTNPVINRSEFNAAGTWSLVVTYSSAGAEGSSATQEVTVS